MTCWGILKDGSQMLLGDPRELVLAYDRDAPADQLKAVFPADRLWETFAQVVVYEGGRGVFRGVVDEQNTRLAEDGLWVELVCRSLEALLLDNEACPEPIRSPSLEKLGRKLLMPLGFERVEGPGDVMPGVLEVEKGVSVWQVLADFCSSCLGGAPYVDAEGVVRCGGERQEEVEVEGVLWAEISHMPCRELSEVYKQSFRGSYDTCYRDREAVAQRRRYSSTAGGDPKSMLEKARTASRRVALECPGAVWPVRGKVVSAELPRIGNVSRLPVVSARCYKDRRGLRTRLVLEGGVDLCG